MKRKTIVFQIVFLLVFMLAACSNSSTISTDQSEINLDKVKRIESIEAGRVVEITGNADKKDIISLLKSLANPINQTNIYSNSKLVLYVDNKKFDVEMSQNYIKIDNKVYYNSTVSEQISSICENYLYRADNYISLLNSNANIELRANDLDKSILLTPNMKSELIEILKKPSRHQSRDEIFSTPPDYPYYQIISEGNRIPSITIYKQPIIELTTSTDFEIYYINSSLYELCSKYLPVDNLKLSGLKELYSYDNLKVKLILNGKEHNDEYKYRMLPIIRLLNEASLSDDNVVTPDDEIDLMFYKGEIVKKVTVYKNGFLYENNYYKYEDLKEIVINTLQAG